MSSRVDIGKDQRITRPDSQNMQMRFRSTIRSMVRNMKETFLPKTGMQKKQVLQDPGYADVGVSCGYTDHHQG